jgi:UDP-glucose 4-epimerase
MRNNILITGAAGFIGSNLANRLLKEKCNLKLVDNFSRGKQSYLDYFEVRTPCIRMDLREYNGYNKGYFEDVDVVYHCASRIGGMQFLHGTVQRELSALQDNLAIDRNVFKFCIEQGVKKIIYMSSISVYNTQRQSDTTAVFSENDINIQEIDPEGGYGWAKYIGEKQLDMISKCGINVGIARIFKSYGPCDDYSDESGQVVCSLMRKAINHPREDFVLWGDGSVTRCLVYIDDLVDGLMKLSEYCNDKSLTVNLGGNEPYPIKLLADKIIALSKKDINIENDMSKLVGVQSRIPNLALAKKKLNWKPTTSLDSGLRKTYKWMEKCIYGEK